MTALLVRVEYEERVAKLISRDEVQAEAFKTFRVFRDRMLSIPDRVAAMVAAETDSTKVHEVLTAEVRAALNEFAGPADFHAAPMNHIQ